MNLNNFEKSEGEQLLMVKKYKYIKIIIIIIKRFGLVKIILITINQHKLFIIFCQNVLLAAGYMQVSRKRGHFLDLKTCFDNFNSYRQ